MEKEHLQPTPGRPPEEGARSQHPGIVAHQQVAGPQQRWQIGEPLVFHHCCLARPGPAADQQAGGVARLGRMLCDERRRQLVVQLVDPHDRLCFGRGGRHASHLLATQPQ